MTLYLPRTTTAQITEALAAERHSIGGGAMNLVLTLVIVTDEAHHHDAVSAAIDAGREHPSRVIALIRRDPGSEPAIDAEIRSPGSPGPGETLLLRLYGPLSEHADSVVTPLLVPDTPMVAWWPDTGPAAPSADPVGRLAHRRITDAQNAADPCAELVERVRHYAPGDTDLVWTRTTPWRSLLASVMDQACGWVTGAVVAGEEHYPSADLLATWLSQRLEVPVRRESSDGPGITEATLDTEDGPVTVSRRDGRTAVLRRPGQPAQTVALSRRRMSEFLAEELRHLDADEMYAHTAACLAERVGETEVGV